MVSVFTILPNGQEKKVSFLSVSAPFFLHYIFTLFLSLSLALLIPVIFLYKLSCSFLPLDDVIYQKLCLYCLLTPVRETASKKRRSRLTNAITFDASLIKKIKAYIGGLNPIYAYIQMERNCGDKLDSLVSLRTRLYAGVILRLAQYE